MTKQTTTDSLQWRASIKHFDPEKKLTPSQMDTLLNALHLSASSFGLQPWHFLVIENPELRQKLKEKSWGQPQIADASHLIVFCRLEKMTEPYIEKHLTHIATTRNTPRESVDVYGQLIKGFLAAKSDDEQSSWMEKQIYIALGALLTAAAIEGIDACPIEGFEKEAYDTLLNLKEKGLRSCVVCALGFRDKDDAYGKAKKVRFPINQVITHII